MKNEESGSKTGADLQLASPIRVGFFLFFLFKLAVVLKIWQSRMTAASSTAEVEEGLSISIQ